MTIDAFVQAEVDADSVSCILRVEAPEHGVVWEAGAGTVAHDDLRPIAPGDAFRAASITKSFTASVVMQLVAERRLALDDSALAHLPPDVHEPFERLHVIDEQRCAADITVRQLLGHTSGLGDHAATPGFLDAIAANPGHRWTPLELLEVAARWTEPCFRPGEGYAYSDTGYVVLGLIVEQLTGQALHTAVRNRILDPLGLTSTYLEGHEPHRGPVLSHAYLGAIDTMVVHGSADWAAGGLVSTAADLAVFVQALVAGEIVRQPLLAETLRCDRRPSDPAHHTPGWLGYGLGVDARASHGRVLIGHRGHWGVLMHIDPASGLTITGTTNQATDRPDRLMHAAVEAVLTHRS